MKAAVLSDIHGNHIALAKCIGEIERRKIDTLIFLGDYIGELAYPQKTMALLRSLMTRFTCFFVRGNKEDYWLEHRNAPDGIWKNGDSTTGMLLYAYNNLRSEDLAFFESMPHRRILSFEELPDIVAYHGSHNRHDVKWKLNSRNLKMLFDDTEETLILCGHTHIHSHLCRDGRTLLNPGSVGVPLESHGLSQFLILTGENGAWKHEFVDLAYDVERVLQDLHEEKLEEQAPSWTLITEHLLQNGTVHHGKVLKRAMELVYQATGTVSWPDIPEEYWKQATSEFGL